jgi:hypothetical protein
MLYSELCPSKYLLTADHFDKVQWRISKNVPLTLGASMAGGLILATKEREMWYEDTEGNDVSLWMFRFYVGGDENSFFWFSKQGDKIRDLEIQHLNDNLIKRIGEIEWNTIKRSTSEK